MTSPRGTGLTRMALGLAGASELGFVHGSILAKILIGQSSRTGVLAAIRTSFGLLQFR
eukprot:CAMPEP_0171116554 /NCGR_PEP_ID=MMETSP0766_2-20121228/90589_1 /TAXON_ID=439317 /ORGANISM="Gambierdiscus australes, Strain CAWD 149" /LENGTH=57 /DNA_ID=CAMNT_0011579003 /DNA_START=27 /DNA_END=196 /DNA_ORIENTATION=+